MKKTVLLSTFLMTITFAFNQVQIEPARMQIEQLSYLKSVQHNKPIFTNSTPKAAGEIVWTEDFSNGLGNWVTSTNTAVQWEIQTPPSFPYNPGVHMATADNGYAIFDVYYLPGYADVNGILEMAESIDLSEYSIATLKFEQSYFKFVDNSFIEISTDGGNTWNQQLNIFANMQVNTEAPVIMHVNFNTNNSAEVKIRFRYTYTANTNPDVGYWWAVDDIEISTVSDNDIAADNLEYGTIDDGGDLLYYYQIPLSQVAPITARVSLTNNGANNQTNVKFIAEETIHEEYTGSSAPINLGTNANQTVSLQNAFTPSAIANYKIEYKIEADAEDDVPVNNELEPYEFKVTESLYARDNSTVAEQGEIVDGYWTGVTQSESTAIKVCNLFRIEQFVYVDAIEFQLGPIIEEGSQSIRGQILSTETEELSMIPNGETEGYIAQAGDEGQYKSLSYTNPIILSPGYYCAAVTSNDVNFSVASAGASPQHTSFIYLEEEDWWFYISTTPVVRIRTLDEEVNIDCAAPTNIEVSNITDNSANISWGVSAYETSWKIVYGPTGFDPDTEGTSVIVSSTNYTITGLNYETTYDVYIQAFCYYIESSWSNVKTFTTTEENCNTPTGVTISNITINSANVGWTAGGSESSWELVYGLVGFDPNIEGTNSVVSSASYSITDLENETTYEVYVRALCDTKNSNWTDVKTFTTGEEDNSSLIDNKLQAILIYPNPSSDKVYIDNFEGYAKIKLYSMEGQLVLEKEISSENNNYIDLKNWRAGAYKLFIEVESGIIEKSIIKK